MTTDDIILAAIERHAARTGSYPENWFSHPRNPNRIAAGDADQDVENSPASPTKRDLPDVR